MSAPERKPIAGYEGLYDVDSDGNVWSVGYGVDRKLSSIVGTHGYCVVALYKDKKPRQYRVHREALQSMAYIKDRVKRIYHLAAGDEPIREQANMALDALAAIDAALGKEAGE